jgi:site-specific DNA recombinase
MLGGRPVLGADGQPVRIAEPLWDRATHDALVKATAPKRDGKRTPKGLRLLTGAAFCGNCGARVRGAYAEDLRSRYRARGPDRGA